MIKLQVVHEVKESYSMRQQGGRNEVVAPTTWGTDWDFFSAANCCRHTLCPCSRYFQEASTVTLCSSQASVDPGKDKLDTLSHVWKFELVFAKDNFDILSKYCWKYAIRLTLGAKLKSSKVYPL